jgi:hypothetical protein
MKSYEVINCYNNNCRLLITISKDKYDKNMFLKNSEIILNLSKVVQLMRESTTHR